MSQIKISLALSASFYSYRTGHIWLVCIILPCVFFFAHLLPGASVHWNASWFFIWCGKELCWCFPTFWWHFEDGAGIFACHEQLISRRVIYYVLKIWGHIISHAIYNKYCVNIQFLKLKRTPLGKLFESERKKLLKTTGCVGRRIVRKL